MIKDLFSSDGRLSESLENYEERSQQREMAEKVFDAFKHSHIALIEAGTGIGKSIAYLAPALYFAHKEKEKTVISTYTISLQEQLIHKDIPFLTNALGIEIHAVLVKGMNNYLCLRKLEAAPEDEEISKLKLFAFS